MKTYELIRDIDDSGVSGTGKIAEACVFSNGRCVVAWVGFEKTGVQSIAVYDSLFDACYIHGHRGHTRFVEVPSEGDGWPDDPAKMRVDSGAGIFRQCPPPAPYLPSELPGIPDDPADT